MVPPRRRAGECKRSVQLEAIGRLMRRRPSNRSFNSRHAILDSVDYRRAFICVCCSHLFVCMFSGINLPSHLPRRLRQHMSGGGRAWRADGAAASLRHIGREKRAIYRLQTAPRHVSGCGGQCAAECAATGAARLRLGERVALSVVCGRGVKIEACGSRESRRGALVSTCLVN